MPAPTIDRSRPRAGPAFPELNLRLLAFLLLGIGGVGVLHEATKQPPSLLATVLFGLLVAAGLHVVVRLIRRPHDR